MEDDYDKSTNRRPEQKTGPHLRHQFSFHDNTPNSEGKTSFSLSKLVIRFLYTIFHGATSSIVLTN